MTVIVLAGVLRAFSLFVDGIELRPGAVLADPVLRMVRPLDATWAVFIALYGLLVTAVVSLANKPNRLLAACQTYALMVLIRIAAMYVTPLDPPEGMIPLEDPLVRMLGPSQLLTRDLFFSGHTATCVLALLATTGAKLRAFLAALFAVVAGGVLVQHVHYTIDVLAAPPFAYVAWALTLRLRRLTGAGELEPAFAETRSTVLLTRDARN